MKIYHNDHAGPWDLLEAATQIPLNRSPCSEILVIGVADSVCDKREAECGHRLRNFKASGGMLTTGDIDQTKLSYSFERDPATHFVTNYAHVAGAKAPPSGQIGPGYGIKHNYSDLHAACWQKGMPPINIYKDFKKVKDLVHGPMAVTQFSKQEDLDVYVRQVHAEWDSKLKALKAQAGLSPEAQQAGEAADRADKERARKRARDNAAKMSNLAEPAAEKKVAKF